MGTDRVLRRLRRLYAALLHLYPAPFHRRFGRGMEQTFTDLCRERRAGGHPLVPFALGLFAETSASILRERIASIMPPRKNLARVVLVTAALLSIPLVAMQFNDGVDWTPGDFLAAGILLLSTGLGFEFVAARARNQAYRAATALAFGAVLLLLWINLAVGLIGSEDNPANALYLAVLGVALLGSALARLRPRPMARALYATALVQALAPLVALVVYRPLDPGGAGLVGVLLLNAFFVVLFVVSAVLFGIAAEAERQRRRISHPA